jgi:hypothetical protein
MGQSEEDGFMTKLDTSGRVVPSKTYPWTRWILWVAKGAPWILGLSLSAGTAILLLVFAGRILRKNPITLES